MLRYLPTILLLFSLFPAFAQLQSPNEFLGYALGDRFTPHHRVVSYFEHVAEQLPNVKLEYYGESYEHRPLLVGYVTSPNNFARLDDIRRANLNRTGLRDSAVSETFDDIAIAWLSYNVHGNEAVSTEAVMAVLYELADASNARTQAWLENTVVILDPCINPDGRDRYAVWYNQHAARPPNAHPDSWEHHEPWPGGRPNHYFFDLNRDWAWATQQETQARLKLYNQWLPHLHADYHEQGVNSPYYFAPAAEPFHELITDWQREFQTTIGANNARYFDEAGWLYFTRERFDLLYPSYGDTYPTYNGAIGMTYEQGGSGRAGLAVLTNEEDTLTLADRIEHHVTTSLSTLEATSQNAARVVSEFARFYQRAQNEPSGTYRSFAVKAGGNPDKLGALRQLLDTHQIRYAAGSGSGNLSGFSYRSGQNGNFRLEAGDLVIPAQQPKSVLLQVLFEPQTSLSDSITYDITAWSVPYAYDLDAYALTDALATEGEASVPEFVPTTVDEAAYAYVTAWSSVSDARFLGQLMQQDIKVRFATRPFTVEGQSFEAGALIITRGNNAALGEAFDQTVVDVANAQQQPLTAVGTGFVSEGFDFGSGEVRYIEPPRIVVATGEDVSAYGFGEIWHYFEQELQYPITPVEVDRLADINLNDYNVLILPDGSYGEALKNLNLADWVKQGGRLIALEDALSTLAEDEALGLNRYASEEEQQQLEAARAEDRSEEQLASYASRERRALSSDISGAIFRLRLDNTHPLALGYPDYYYTLKRGTARYAYLSGGWNVGTLAGREDLVSGFVGADVQEQLTQSLVFGVEEKGSGSVVYLVDNPLFRQFWYNGKLLFANAVFLVGQD
ncbi:MAG: M14 family metallopeptidase [Tunicatimonas sp.]